MSISMPASSSARSAPMCEKPRAPPPPSTSAVARPLARRARRRMSRSSPSRTWWCVATRRPSSQAAVPDGRAAASGWTSTSSHRAVRPIGAIDDSSAPGTGSSPARPTISTRSAWRTQRRVHGVSPASATSTRKRCSRSCSDSHATMDSWIASSSAVCAIPSRPSRRSTSALARHSTASGSPSAAASRRARSACGAPGEAGTSANADALGVPRSGRPPPCRRRHAAARAICSIARGWRSSRRSNEARGSRRRSLSRTAVMVAARGSPVRSASSPTARPRPASSTTRCPPGALGSAIVTRKRPLTTM